MPEYQCAIVVNNYAENNQIPVKLAIVGITKLIQDGGTNQSKKGLTVTVGNHSFELSKLRSIITAIDKTSSVKKFAKGYRDIIANIASLNKWPGPLAKDIKRNNPDID